MIYEPLFKKIQIKEAVTIFAAGILLLSVSTQVNAVPPPDEYGFKYYAILHESGLYNGTEFYQKNYSRMYSVDGYLQNISIARYKAIDQPIKTMLNEAIIEVADDEGLSIKSSNVSTDGKLKLSFVPSDKNNTLDYKINGLSVTAKAKFKKGSFLEGSIKLSTDNIIIKGEYDYFGGNISVSKVSIPIDVDVDVDLDIPIIGDIIDPFIDYYVDHQIVAELPNNLGKLFNGGNGLSYTVAGIENAIPVGELIYNGIDYGEHLKNKLSQSSLINDNFSITIGELVFNGQYFDVTIGKLTYKRWTTGGREICIVSPADPDCV